MTSNHLPATGTTRREEFGGLEHRRSAETAVSAAAAQAQAQVQAMYIMALQRPRDWMAVREKLLNECERRGLAEVARYTLPWMIDQKTRKPVTGPSIRLAEAALRSMTNIHVKTMITYDDEQRRIGEVLVIDLETNTPLAAGFSIEKSREVKKLKGGEVVLGERVNSNGETTYRIIADEAQVNQKQESIVSRHLRNLILRILPGDLLDEALAQCDETLEREDEQDPAGTAKKIADGFHSLGISATQLRDYLGHAVDQVTPDEARDLRGVYSALKDQQTTWTEVMESRHADQPATTDEKASKALLLKRIATARIQDGKAYAAAREYAGVGSGVQDSALPVETLTRMAESLDAAAGTGAAKPAMDPEIKSYMDQLGAAPAEEV